MIGTNIELCPLCRKKEMKVTLDTYSDNAWGRCLNCNAYMDNGIIKINTKNNYEIQITDDYIDIFDSNNIKVSSWNIIKKG